MQMQLDTTAVHYKTKGEGFPIVILSGFSLDHQVMMGAFEPIFSERDGFQRIYPDLPGTGFTPASDDLVTSARIIDLVVQFIDDLLGDKPFMLIGFSYGGFIARGVLKQRQSQVVGLGLIAPSVNLEQGVRDLPEQMVIAHDADAVKLLPETVAATVMNTLSAQTRPVIERILAEFMASFPRGDQDFLTTLRQDPHFSYSPDIDQLETEFDAPALIVTGRHDTSVGYTGAFHLAKQYRRATYATLDRAGHGVYLEQDRIFTVLMHEWLDRVQEYLSSSA